MKSLMRKFALIAGGAALAVSICLSPLAGARARESALSDQTQVDSAEQEADQQVAASQEQIRSALQGVKAAEVELNRARASGDQQRIDQAQAAYDKSVADANAAIGRPGVDVGAMRADGMGWGEIAHASGLHPAALAFGRYKKQVPPQAPVQPQPAPAEQAEAPAKAMTKADKAKPTLSADKFAKGKHRSELTGDNGLSSGERFGGDAKGGKGGGHGNKGGNGKGGSNGNGHGNGNGGGKGGGHG